MTSSSPWRRGERVRARASSAANASSGSAVEQREQRRARIGAREVPQIGRGSRRRPASKSSSRRMIVEQALERLAGGACRPIVRRAIRRGASRRRAAASGGRKLRASGRRRPWLDSPHQCRPVEISVSAVFARIEAAASCLPAGPARGSAMTLLSPGRLSSEPEFAAVQAGDRGGEAQPRARSPAPSGSARAARSARPTRRAIGFGNARTAIGHAEQ